MFKSILMPIDGSTLSCKPLPVVVDLARQLNVKLVFLSVAEPRLYNGSDADAVRTGEEVESGNLSSAQKNVGRALASARSANVRCEAVVSLSRVPCDEILSTAERLHCDAIVMATRGKMGVIDSLFNESVTQELLKKSSIPVLVFP